MLRTIRRFYLNLFKKENVKIVRDRYCNSKSSSVIKALIRFWDKYKITEDSSLDLAKFIVIFTGIKPNYKSRSENVVELQAESVRSWMQNYSLTKFWQLHKIKEFKALFKYIYIQLSSWKHFRVRNHFEEIQRRIQRNI